MRRLENMKDNINRYLTNKGLPRLKGSITDIYTLFEESLRSVWEIEDKERRETFAVEIAQALKPYFGGKKIEEALDEVIEKLNKEEKIQDKNEEKQKKIERIQKLKERMKDPDYVPTFEELMKIKGKSQ